jgi:hypothetical protein
MRYYYVIILVTIDVVVSFRIFVFIFFSNFRLLILVLFSPHNVSQLHHVIFPLYYYVILYLFITDLTHIIAINYKNASIFSNAKNKKTKTNPAKHFPDQKQSLNVFLTPYTIMHIL